MKVCLSRKATQLASALLTTLVICSILSIFVMYYLSLIDQQSYLSARSQVWNMAIAVSEAGVEEGLQHLNANYPSLAVDGWSSAGANAFCKSNTINDGSGNSYFVTIYLTNGPYPLILSRAYVTSVPKYGMSSGRGFFATGGQNTPEVATVTRAVAASTKRGSLFTVSMVAKHNIDLNGNNISTDSFDSNDPTKSLNGQWSPTLAYKGDKGDIASNLGVIDSLNIGNADIYGHAHTGPGSPSSAVQIGPNGYIGPHSGFANGVISPGWWMPDSNFTFPDTTYPNTASYFTPTNGNVITSTNALTFGSQVTYTYPNLPPGGGASTNYGSSTTSSTFPALLPASPITTNTVNTSTWPSPPPASLVTNTTYVVNQSTAPAIGTYVGPIATTNWNNGKYGTYYSFWEITGYSYKTFSYYTSYTYTPYVTNVVYMTNHYDNILWGTTTASATNYYVASSLSGSTIVLGQNVVLALPNGLSQGGGDSIILNQGNNLMALGAGGLVTSPLSEASITVYAGGTSASISGNGVVNQPGRAIDFLLYCAPSVTSFSFNGNGQFTGILVAPSVDLTMNGGGSSRLDFVGCVMVNSVTMNGHFNFHYDEALADASKNGRFLITSWNEIK